MIPMILNRLMIYQIIWLKSPKKSAFDSVKGKLKGKHQFQSTKKALKSLDFKAFSFGGEGEI